RTAYLREPYRDPAPDPAAEPAVGAEPAAGAATGPAPEPADPAVGAAHGHAYLTAEQVRDHLLDCHEVGVQAGFHAIGDAAIATVLAGFAAAADRLGRDQVRAARH